MRGAYLVSEARRAAADGAGRAPPTHATKAETDAAYDGAVARVLGRIAAADAAAAAGRARAAIAPTLLVATHNRASVFAATAKLAELGIARDDGRVHFAQILGMADDVTGALAAAGHNAHKLALFGGLEQIVPWLMRRLDENVGMLAATAGERALLLREIRRRLVA